MTKSGRFFRRPAFAISAAVLTFAAMLPSLLWLHSAYAAGQVTVRSITMSTSAPSASNVTYTVTFTPFTNVSHPDVVLDFCSNSPLIGDSCTATAGTDVPNFSSAAATGYTVSTIGSNRGIKLTTTTVDFTASTPVTITVTGVTNPSNVGPAPGGGSFYGRVLTYATGGAGTNTSVSPGSYTDYGGIALSTANSVTITAKVFETLSFCLYTGGSCGTTAPSVSLGDTTTGALSSTDAYVNSGTKFDLATNAGGGITVVMRGTTLCRDSDTTKCKPSSGSYAASTVASVGATAATRAIGTEQFGMCANKNSSSALSVASAYNDTVNNCQGLSTGLYNSGTSKFGFDDNVSTGTNSAGGSTILTSAGAVPSVTGGLSFLGNIAATTEAGIYSTSLNMVATGTF